MRNYWTKKKSMYIFMIFTFISILTLALACIFIVTSSTRRRSENARHDSVASTPTATDTDATPTDATPTNATPADASKDDTATDSDAATTTEAITQATTETTTEATTQATTETTTEATTVATTQAPTTTAAPTTTEALTTATQPTTEGAGIFSIDSSNVPFMSVDGSYFADALFIGDSRTEGLSLYSGIQCNNFVAYRGLGTKTIYTKKYFTQNNVAVTGMEKIKYISFSKAYIMLGINETYSGGENGFIDRYRNIINDIRAVNPQAIIYIQSILPVSASVSSQRPNISNPVLASYNVRLKQLAAELGVIYLNVAEAVADSSGALPSEAGPDGIHFGSKYAKLWLAYLQNHAYNNQAVQEQPEQ